MPVLEATHDLAHPVEADEAWSESYYFNAYDPTTDSGFFTRIGIRPNEGTIDVGMTAWLPDGGIAEYHHVREQTEMIDSDLEVGGVRYRMLSPMESWQLTADIEATRRSEGDAVPNTEQLTPIVISVDATFEALAPAIGTEGGGSPRGVSARTAGTVGRGHLEQAGRWRGSLSIDGERREWQDARGNRDKSWGPRRWGGPRMWRWFSINIGDDSHFGGIRIDTGQGELHRGWVWRDGEATSIRDWGLSTTLADDGFTHQSLRLTATDKRDRQHVLEGDVLRVAPVRYSRDGQTTIINEGLTRWSYEGRTGYGISEYLHQLDPDGNPLVAVD